MCTEFCTDIHTKEIMTIDGDDDGGGSGNGSGSERIKYDFRFSFFLFVFGFAFSRGEWWSEAERVHPTKIFLRKKQLKRILILYRFKSNKHHICSSICSLILHTNFFFISSFLAWILCLVLAGEWLCFGCDTYMRARRDIRSHSGPLVCVYVYAWITTNYTCARAQNDT